jgi:hypothetical protein
MALLRDDARRGQSRGTRSPILGGSSDRPSGLLQEGFWPCRSGSATPHDSGLRDTVELTARASVSLDGVSRVGDPEDASDATGRHKHRADHDDLMERANRLVVRGEAVPDEAARDKQAHDRDTDEAGDPGDGVVDGGRDASIGLVGIGEDPDVAEVPSPSL